MGFVTRPPSMWSGLVMMMGLSFFEYGVVEAIPTVDVEATCYN